MPRRSKGPRLYLRTGLVKKGRSLPDVWVIRDGPVEISTGCGPDRLSGPDGAESQLAAYIARKWSARPGPADAAADDAERVRDPARVLIAEVLALYIAEKAPKLANPANAAASIKTLMPFWGDKTLTQIRRSTCEAYVVHRTAQPRRAAKTEAAKATKVSDQAARRELEDLSAAIGYWTEEHHLTTRPKVILPPKPESPRDALTRDQAAALLKAARGRRWDAKAAIWKPLGNDSAASNRRHLTRFIRIGLRSGSRPGVTLKLLWGESARQAWVDEDRHTIFRRGRLERDHRTKRRPLVKIPGRLAGDFRRWRAIDARLNVDRAAAEPAMPPVNTVIHHGGAPIASVRKGFAGCVRDAGLPAEITPHWLRHTCATWLMEGDADLWEAAGYLGMTAATLEKHYGHHRPDHQAAARKALR